SGATFNLGVTTVTCTASDSSPDSPDSTCTFTATVKDTQAPTIGACPSTVTVDAASGQCTATATYTAPTATDNCGSATVTCAPASGSSFNVGVTTVTCTASDTSPDSPDSTCTFIVTVKDTQAPAITCPPNQTGVTNGVVTTAVVTFNPTASDNCGSATINCMPPSGNAFALGTTTITCTASDTSTDSSDATCSFTVVVRTPRAAVNNLKTQVQALVPATLTQTQANSLLSYLELAGTHLEQGNNGAACTDLANFVARCNALTPPMTTAQRDNLIIAANKIRNALGVCGMFTPAKKAGVFSAQRGEFYLKQHLTTGLPDQVERYGETGD